MPRLALVLVLFWFLSLFVFRSALQWWQTGSTGVKGFSGKVGSLEWNAGLMASFGLACGGAAPRLACGGAAPLAALFGWPGGGLFFASHPLHLLGAVLTTLGIIGAWVSQVSMGHSWRVGVDQSEETTLVTEGLFSWVRNPIFSFILVSGVGLVALVPNAPAVLALVLTAVGIELQVRAVEEPYLSRVHGAAYEAYCSQTGRFFPGVGRGH